MTREEAIEYLQAIMPESYYEKVREAVQMAIEALKRPKQKNGRWKECKRVGCTQFHPDYSSFYSMFYCTSCLQPNYRMAKYCPNCGAKMEG